MSVLRALQIAQEGVIQEAPVRRAAGRGGSLAGMERLAWRCLSECDGKKLRQAGRVDVQAGRQASRGGVWVVQEVLEVRHPLQGRRGRKVDRGGEGEGSECCPGRR